MNTKDFIKMKGRVDVKLIRNGVVVQEIKHHNMIVHVGKQFIIQRIKDGSVPPVRWMAIGTGTTSPTSADTALEVEVSRLGIATPVDNDTTLVFTGIFPAGNGEGDITEAGLFNADSAGTMLARTTFPVVPKGEFDDIAISWYISLS